MSAETENAAYDTAAALWFKAAEAEDNMFQARAAVAEAAEQADKAGQLLPRNVSEALHRYLTARWLKDEAEAAATRHHR